MAFGFKWFVEYYENGKYKIRSFLYDEVAARSFAKTVNGDIIRDR